MSNLRAALQKTIGESLAAEGITPDVLAAVDLSIAYSPVIAISGETLTQAVEVTPTQGGRYLVRHPMYPSSVDAAALKVMRARYLLTRDAVFAPQVQQFFAMRAGPRGQVQQRLARG